MGHHSREELGFLQRGQSCRTVGAEIQRFHIHVGCALGDVHDAAGGIAVKQARDVAEGLVDYDGPLNDEVERVFAGRDVQA